MGETKLIMINRHAYPHAHRHAQSLGRSILFIQVIASEGKFKLIRKFNLHTNKPGPACLTHICWAFRTLVAAVFPLSYPLGNLVVIFYFAADKCNDKTNGYVKKYTCDHVCKLRNRITNIF